MNPFTLPGFSLALRAGPADSILPDLIQKKSVQINKYLGRAIWENLAFLGVTYIFYLVDVSTNRVDWQYGLNFKDQFKRFFTLEAVELDNNNFGVNTNHVSQGYLTHLIARSNHLNLYETLLFNFVSSSFWEYVMEYRENISLNDQVFATFGGFAVGESFYQIGKYMSFNREDNLYGIISWILASPYRLNRLLFRSKKKNPVHEDKYLHDDFTKRFDFSMGLSNFGTPQSDTSQSNFDFSFDLRLMNRKLGAGKFRQPFNRTLFSHLTTRLRFSLTDPFYFN